MNRRRSLRGASRSEMAARVAALEWMQKSLDKLKPSGDPEVMLQVATAFSKMSTSQMKVRQIKGNEEDEMTGLNVNKKLDALQDSLGDGVDEGNGEEGDGQDEDIDDK